MNHLRMKYNFFIDIITTPNVGPNPSSILCPSCRQQVVTRMDYETSTKTHLMAGLLCAFM